MSNLILKGKIEDNMGNALNGTIKFNNSKHKVNNGEFIIDFEIFKGTGGSDESHRLNVPLLAKIPIDSDLATCTDMGTPYVEKHTNTYINQSYAKIANEIIKLI